MEPKTFKKTKTEIRIDDIQIDFDRQASQEDDYIQDSDKRALKSAQSKTSSRSKRK